MTTLYQILDWDTEILGIKTARLLPATLTLDVLREALVELKQQGVRLVYWASDSNDQNNQQAAVACGGLLADRKVTYGLDIAMLDQGLLENTGVEVYVDKLPNAQLELLAVETGLQSRFGMDPNITRQQLENVYKTWITNSVNGAIAKKVLVIKQEQKIIAMITLGEKNNRGDIGLLAVDPNYRGQQLGVRLVKAAQRWCIDAGYRQAQVVTQMENVAACRLYEKCGYQIETVENFYHFWL